MTEYFTSMTSCAVAFSGGLDSTVIATVAHDVLKDNMMAVTLNTPYMPQWEVEEAIRYCRQNAIPHHVVTLPILDSIVDNPPDRCYLCKKALFLTILELAQTHNISSVIDGTNHDDLKDYRPGMKALKELGIKSPFLDLGIAKQDIKTMAKDMGIGNWNKMPCACLLSRLPHGVKIEEADLRRIEKAEEFLINLGFDGCRVRTHGDLARIEMRREKRAKFLHAELLDAVADELKKYGYKYVAFDLEGYRCGSMNERERSGKNN